MDEIQILIDKLNSRNWVEELTIVNQIYASLPIQSVRRLSKLIERSSSWCGVSLILIKGIKEHPDLCALSTRNLAYTELSKKKKFERFLNT